MNHDDFFENPPHGEPGHECEPFGGEWLTGGVVMIHPNEYALLEHEVEYEDGSTEEGVMVGLNDHEAPMPVGIVMSDGDAARLAVMLSVKLGMEVIEQAFIELRQLRAQAAGKVPESAEVIREQMTEQIRQVAVETEQERQRQQDDFGGFDFGGLGL